MNPIGTKQTLILLILAGLAGAFYYYSYVHIAPVKQRLTSNINVTSGQISSMRQEMQELQSGYNKFLDIKQEYDQIVDVGFFDDQNRLEAQKLIEIIQSKSRVLSARYAIKPLKPEDNERAEAVDYELVATEIDINIEAIEDSDIYDFFFMLTNGLPGHVEVRNFSMKKVTEVTQPLLRQIGSGNYEPVVNASLKITWRTFRKKEVSEDEVES